ncbi:MAG: metalloregulator ArsR/SmtB family transcription factor [Pseudomonadota bacterium]
MNETAAVETFQALAHGDRLAVVRALVQAGPDGLSAGEIATAVEASPSRASFHLSVLAEAGLVASERQARRLIYRVQFERLGALVSYLIEDCCRGSEQVRACCR